MGRGGVWPRRPIYLSKRNPGLLAPYPSFVPTPFSATGGHAEGSGGAAGNESLVRVGRILALLLQEALSEIKASLDHGRPQPQAPGATINPCLGDNGGTSQELIPST